MKYFILIVLISLGIIISLYLILTRRSSKSLVCPTGYRCNDVVNTKWSKLFGKIHNDTLGIIFYIILSILMIYLSVGSLIIDLANIGYLLFSSSIFISFLAATYSLFLLGIQFFVIKKRCLYCIIMAIINLTILFLLYNLYFMFY